MASRAITIPLAFVKNGCSAPYFTQYFTSSRTEKKLYNQFQYDESGDNSIEVICCSRISYDQEHYGYSYHIDVRRYQYDGEGPVIRLYSSTFDTEEECIVEHGDFKTNCSDYLYITQQPRIYLNGSTTNPFTKEEVQPTEEQEQQDEYDVNTKELVPFTDEMKDTHTFYVGIPVYDNMLFTDQFYYYEDALEFYKNGFQEHGVIGRELQFKEDGSHVVRFGNFSLWAFNQDTMENYYFSMDLKTLIHEDFYDIDIFTGTAEDPDYIPTQTELEESEKEDEEALIEMEIEMEKQEVENEEETEEEEDLFMLDLRNMRLKPYGKGCLLIPSKSEGDKELMGTKYFLGGWWMPQRNAWFFKTELVQDLIDLGAKRLHKSEKDRTGLSSKKVYWKKLERGYAIVPKEDYKHYGKYTFRGGKWWKNGNAWFFTDNGRERYIEQYGSSMCSTKTH